MQPAFIGVLAAVIGAVWIAVWDYLAVRAQRSENAIAHHNRPTEAELEWECCVQEAWQELLDIDPHYADLWRPKWVHHLRISHQDEVCYGIVNDLIDMRPEPVVQRPARPKSRPNPTRVEWS